MPSCRIKSILLSFRPEMSELNLNHFINTYKKPEIGPSHISNVCTFSAHGPPPGDVRWQRAWPGRGLEAAYSVGSVSPGRVEQTQLG